MPSVFVCIPSGSRYGNVPNELVHRAGPPFLDNHYRGYQYSSSRVNLNSHKKESDNDKQGSDFNTQISDREGRVNYTELKSAPSTTTSRADLRDLKSVKTFRALISKC